LKPFYLLAIIPIVGLITLATQYNPEVESAIGNNPTAKKMIGTILDSGAMAVFDQAIDAPVTEFIYKETEQIIIDSLSSLQLRQLINQIPDGEYKDYVTSLGVAEQIALFTRIQNETELTTQEEQILEAMEKQKLELAGTNQTQTVIKEIKTSELTLTAEDRQTGVIKKCKVGNQCDITGKFVVVDIGTNEIVSPPYSVFLTIDCDALDWCNLKAKGVQEVTENDGTWKYSWTVAGNELPGNYDIYAKASVEKDGITHWVDGSGIVEVVE
jgi:hypothetical protein